VFISAVNEIVVDLAGTADADYNWQTVFRFPSAARALSSHRLQ
jgi:hypothetical protein